MNDWDETATPMEEVEPGVYEVTKTLRPGEYEYKFVENGEDWIEPEDADEYTADDHGGENAVLDISEDSDDLADDMVDDTAETEEMEIDSGQPDTLFVDYTGNVDGVVETDADGVGEFKVKECPEDGWSVWVPLRN